MLRIIYLQIRSSFNFYDKYCLNILKNSILNNLRRKNYLKKFIKINYLFFIICLSFLLYQLIDLYIEFMSGETVINISVGIIRNTSLPAITLCLDNLDFSKLSLLNDNVSTLYKEYLALIENADRHRINYIGNYLFQLYIQALIIYFDSNEQNILIKDILNNLTPLTNEIDGTFLSSTCYHSSAYGDIDKDLSKYDSETYTMKSLPMESLEILTYGNYPVVWKCYTLFSHTESSWNNIKMVFDRIIINLQVDTHSLPFFPSNEILIIMHSPNTLSLEGHSFIDPGYVYVIEFSKWNIIRLGKGYDTDCREYNPKKYTRNDCIFDCYQERARYFCQTNNFVSYHNMLRKKNYFEQSNLNFSKCNIKTEIRHKILELCNDKCHKECHITYYSFTV